MGPQAQVETEPWGTVSTCARCGLTKINHPTPDSRTGWKTYYKPSDPPDARWTTTRSDCQPEETSQ